MTQGKAPTLISSRDNALIKELRKLHSDGALYRKTGQIWIEGEHLCQAYRAYGLKPDNVILSTHYYETNQAKALWEYAQDAIKVIVIPDALFADISSLDSVAGIGFICRLPAHTDIDPAAPTVVLDRLQDPGNVGSILRSAAGFGYTQAIALKGTVALYAPKVLRAGMGAHFGLRLIEAADPADLAQLQLPLAVTSSHQGRYLHELLQKNELLRQYPKGLNWVLGHEGQGVSADLQTQAALHVRIAQPGGQESLNVAAAAAICMHASATAIISGF